jgi:hypothetical protein
VTVDNGSREYPTRLAETALRHAVVRELERLVIERGTPKMAVRDNASELSRNAVTPSWHGSIGAVSRNTTLRRQAL